MMEHPIENLMKTAMTNLKEMVDVNTIVGSPVSTADGHVVLTVSKVAFGFGAGGSDFKGEVSRREQQHTHAGQGSQKRNETRISVWRRKWSWSLHQSCCFF